ncbi:unnamed protein product [Urochloa decumbens]|uniref:C2H2-type domain-containing protein n=1 Tax=Urochloa decumbens TaxID=240449 RepID=A0ABC8YDM9_9POAL
MVNRESTSHISEDCGREIHYLLCLLFWSWMSSIVYSPKLKLRDCSNLYMQMMWHFLSDRRRLIFTSQRICYPSLEKRQEVGTDSVSDDFKRESTVSQQQSSLSCPPAHRQTANWYPIKKKVKVPHTPQILQCPRRNVVPSFWCKICKVDCVTEFNFGAHIGGKKHKAKKLEILGNRNTGRPGSQCSGNRLPVQNSHPVSSGMVSANCNLSSESRINGTQESGCTAPAVSSMDFTEI